VIFVVLAVVMIANHYRDIPFFRVFNLSLATLVLAAAALQLWELRREKVRDTERGSA
jgi:hypothetical protein